MRRRSPFIWMAVILLLFLSAVQAAADENTGSLTIDPEAWSWEPGIQNVFEGYLDVAGYEDQTLTIELKADYEPSSDGAEQPVFVYANGKRFTVLKQSSRCQTEMNGTGKLTFSGRLTMPEKDHCTRAVLSVFAYDSDGKIIASASAAVGESETAPGSAGKQFFLPINIRQWAIWLAAAALLIWACAAVRKKLAERKQ